MSDARDVLVFNPLPWEREIAGPIPEGVVMPRGVPGDPTSGRHFQDHDPVMGFPAGIGVDSGEKSDGPQGYALAPTSVPGFGYAVVAATDLHDRSASRFDERATVETERYRLVFDRERGGIRKWEDRECGRQLIDQDAEYPFAGFVHETVADESRDYPRRSLFDFGEQEPMTAIGGLPGSEGGFAGDWHARRTGPREVRRHRVYETPRGYEVRQRLDVPEVASDVELRVLVPHDGETVVVKAEWTMSRTAHPEATYLAFPFDIAEPTPRVDVGGHAMVPGRDQLAGSCHDYYTAGRWADLSGTDAAGEECGVTVGCPLNPIVGFGEFGFAADRSELDLDHARLLGWVTNNYWDTNFRAHQSGRVRARYHLTPHDGFAETDAHRLGLAAEHHSPTVQTMAESATASTDESPTSGASLPTSGQLLDLPEPPILVHGVRPDDGGPGVFHREYAADTDGTIMVLSNAADGQTTARVGSGVLEIERVERVGILGEPRDGDELAVTDSSIEIELDARETATFRFEIRR